MTHATQAPTSSTSSRNDAVRLDIMLRLLDHQIVGPEGELLGNVDDVELVDTGAGLFVTGLAIGPASLAQRLPGRIGDWLYAIWRRLHPDSDPKPLVLPIERVTSIDSAVEVDGYAAKALGGAFGLEQWLRRYVVSRIPGAKGGGDERDAAQLQPVEAGDDQPESAKAGHDPDGSAVRSPLPDARFVSGLVGRTLLDASTRRDLGRICEIHAAAGPLDRPQVPMQVTHLQYGRHLRGSELGYNADRKQGPWIVAAVVRHWQRDNRVVPMGGIGDLWSTDGQVVLTGAGGLSHPYEVDDW